MKILQFFLLKNVHVKVPTVLFFNTTRLLFLFFNCEHFLFVYIVKKQKFRGFKKNSMDFQNSQNHISLKANF